MGHHPPAEGAAGGRQTGEEDLSTEANNPDLEPPGPDEIEAGRLLFARECQFVAGAVKADQIPDGTLPEIAFAGRSNVGKSSLVNALTGRKTLARVSQTPGRTQQLNFFDLGERLCLVDLPGYGYHQAGKGAAAGWARVIEQYLRGRAELQRVLVLIDARHGPKDTDIAVMKLMDKAAIGYQAVLTKIDKAEAELDAVRARTLDELRKHVAAHPRLLETSSATGQGVPELRAELTRMALPPG